MLDNSRPSGNDLRGSREIIKRDRAALARPTEAGAEVMETELSWVVHTVALAVLNPSEMFSIELVDDGALTRA